MNTGWISMDLAPRDYEKLLARIEDEGGAWHDLITWSDRHGCFLPVSALPDPRRWFADVEANGTKITGWMALPPL